MIGNLTKIPGVDFIKPKRQNFHIITTKNNGIFKVQLHNKNLALKTPKWVTKMPKWAAQMLKLATCCSIFVAKKKLAFLTPKYIFWHFYANKKTPTLKLLCNGPLVKSSMDMFAVSR